MKIKNKLLIFVGAMVGLILSASFIFIYDSQQNQAMELYHQQARAISEDLGLLRHLIQEHGGIYVKKTETVETNPYLAKISNLSVDIQDTRGNEYTLLNSFAFIREMTQDVHGIKTFYYRTPSKRAMNPINDADEFERQIIGKFESGEISEYTAMERDENNDRIYRYMSPYIASEICLKCHPFVENVGDVVGAISITIPIEEAEKRKEDTLNTLLAFFIFATFVVVGVVYFLADHISKPIERLFQGSERIREGDIGYNVEIMKTEDELESLASAFNMMSTELKRRIDELTGLKQNLEIKVFERTMEIEETKEFLQKIMDNMGEGLVAVDQDYNILEANESYLESVGMEKDEIMGKKCYQVSHHVDEPCIEPEHLCPINHVFKTGKPSSTIHTHYKKDGSEQFIEIHAYPVKDKKGDIIMGIEISRDITERKESEKKLKDYSVELEKSNEMKDLFTDIMRHDLLNPAGMISNFSEMLIKDYPENEDLQTVYKSSQKLIKMITLASAFSKLESAEKLDFFELNLKDILEEVCKNQKHNFRSAGMELTCNLTEDLPIKANIMIEDVFENLLTNAMKYAPSGRKVFVDVQVLPDKYRISVKDFGLGIPDENKNTIFHRFKRTHKGAVRGTGLGLAIVKRLVELHNGRVWVEDNPEGGAVFIVELPRNLDG